MGVAARHLGDWQFRAGAVLASARDALGWSVEEAARRAGMEAAHVRAIESEAFDHFLAPHIAAAHARTYAAALGVSEAWVEGLVRAEFAPQSVAERAPPERTDRSLAGVVIDALVRLWRRLRP